MNTSDPSDLTAAVRAALAEPAVRVRAVDLPDGRRFWLKRVERLSVRLRLQKGDPRKSFAAEREGLRALADRGLPVAPVVLEGPDYLVMPDVGLPLPRVAHADRAGGLRAFAAAGRALGRLHRAGLVHGRPAPRDICWDGAEARFIDLERFSPARRGGFWQAMDIVIFTQGCFSRFPDDPRWLDAALDAYRHDAPDGAMERVARLARRLRPLGWLASAARLLRPASKELRAVGLTLRRLARAS